MAKKKKVYDDDDGRTIANMNIEGMPWYVDEERRARQKENGEPVELTKAERRAYTAGAIKAGLLAFAFFGLGFFLFILFCIYVWFR